MALSRYQNTTAIRYENKGKFHLQTPVFVNGSELAAAVSFITIKYTAGTRLDVLAQKYLGDGRYWWAICMMNDPNLTVGSMIRVPENITDVVKYMKKV